MSRQPGALSTESEAMQIVLQEDQARGRTITKLSKAQERANGCDFLSELDGEVEYVEVKGWGEPLVLDGSFTYRADVNAEQREAAAVHGPNFRLELVGNLAEVRVGGGTVQRLTLNGAEVVAHATPLKYAVELESFVARVEL